MREPPLTPSRGGNHMKIVLKNLRVALRPLGAIGFGWSLN